MGYLFGPEWISLWVSGAALLGLAVWLFALDVTSRAQRAFALLLALRGLTFFVGPLRGEASGVQEAVAWAAVTPYLVLPIPFLVVGFLSLYPRRRGLARGPWGLPLLTLAIVAVLVAYLANHTLYQAIIPAVPAANGALGPLFFLKGISLPSFAAAGFVLAGDYARSPKGSAGFSLFLLVAAFILNGLYDGTLAALDLAGDMQGGVDLGGWEWTRSVLPVLALPIALAALLRLGPALRQARHEPELQELRRFVVFGVPLALATPFVRLLPIATAEDIATFLFGIWRLLIPFLIAYALMRYQLFDIDIRIKAGIRRGIIVGAFTVTFFLVSEAAESLVQGDRGALFGIFAAGVLSLASRPLKAVAERASNAFMPDTKPIAQQSYRERLAFYLEQHQLVTRDGQLSPKERRMLDRLAITLALPGDAVTRLEAAQAVPADADDGSAAPAEAAETKDTRLETLLKGALATGAMALVFGMLSQGIESFLPISDQVAGLVAAAAVALLLGPLETLADRLTHRFDPRAATEASDEKERHAAFQSALATALEDGSLSPRDLSYLAGLQAKLRISRSARWRMERRVRRRLGV